MISYLFRPDFRISGTDDEIEIHGGPAERYRLPVARVAGIVVSRGRRPPSHPAGEPSAEGVSTAGEK